MSLLTIISGIYYNPIWYNNIWLDVLVATVGSLIIILWGWIGVKYLALNMRKNTNLLTILSSIIFFPIMEEMIFRNLIFNFFVVDPKWAIIIISALFFSVCHENDVFPEKNGQIRINLKNMGFIFIGGVIIATCFYFSNYCITVAIILHIVHNSYITIVNR
jgi:membrane protease YdiL (CAAX protease family)